MSGLYREIIHDRERELRQLQADYAEAILQLAACREGRGAGDQAVSLVAANEVLAAERDKYRSALERVWAVKEPIPIAAVRIIAEALR